jgi:hypothetical protein
MKDFSTIDSMMKLIREGVPPDWKKFKEKKTSKIYYKQEPGLSQITLYLEEVFEASLINLVAVIGEVQLFKKWVPLMRQSDLLADVSYLRKFMYFRNAMPWPMKSRECYV